MIIKILQKRNNAIPKEDLQCYVDAFMYEPAVWIDKSDDPDSYKYLYRELKTLPAYLQHFMHDNGNPNIQIDHSGPEFLHCNGIESVNDPHIFLLSENHFTCNKCKKLFCATCGYAQIKIGIKKEIKVFLIVL